MKKIYALLILALGCMSYSHAQVTVSGVVTSDVEKVPVPGVSVYIKGEPKGAVTTDFDGNFVIKAQQKEGFLVFSYVGFTTKEVAFSGTQKVNVSLTEEVSTLNEVVVVGYGSQKRSDVTGAIASVKSENFNKGVVANAGQLIQGKVAGVNVVAASGEPGANQDIIIRGVGSLRSGTTPLYVVDGFALDNSNTGVASNPLNFINPQDIESIEVLKDASASAIYGSRAANGVIVITTKKGSKGRTQINLSMTSGFSTLTNKVKVFNADEFRKQVVAVNGTLQDGGANTDWQDELTRTGVSQNLNFSMSGGTDKSTYAASIGVDNQQGVLQNSDLKRYSGRLNLNQKALNDKFNVAFNLTATKLENSRPDARGVVGNMLTMNPTDAVYVNGEPNVNLSNDVLNPIISQRLYSDETNNNRILANIAPSYEFIKGLTYKFNLGVDYSMSERDIQVLPYRSATNTTLGSLNNIVTTNNNTLYENTLTYNFNAKKHSFTILAGQSYQKIQVNQKNYNLSGFPDNGVEPKNQIETASERTTQSSSAVENELQSFFGRLNYGYDNKYLLTATMRADGSSKFGKNNRYGYFPSVALGWNISKEDFLKESETINNLKLRASWGKTGSQEIPSKITKASYTESNTGNDTYPLDPSATDLSGYPYGSIYTRLANPNIQWEVSTQANIGLDFSLFNNRLSGTVDYFNKVSENILLEVAPVDPIQPTSKYWTNIPNMQIKNNGIEVALDYSSDKSRDFSYSIGGNISFTDNKVVNSPYKILTTGGAQGGGQSGATINGVINGQPIGSFYMLDFIGIGADGLNQFADTNGDGKILDDDRIVAGSALPDYIYAFYLNFKYKNFDLGVNFNGAGGNKIYNHVAMSSFNRGQLANSFNTTDRASQYLNEASTNSNTVSTRYLEDGSYLRLNNATLGYNLRPKMIGLDNVMDNIRLSITGQNLFVITKYSGYDPEINTGTSVGDIQSFGIDYFSYPRSRTVLFGLNVAF
ncbi:SusC/RagA family TonB-linked outer membrane protein [Flavobacterium hibernum]|uniref:SusC/RagA family TonB-linked outer membrane protein n=1 Tax=Flavobacterium hibernum TaxID=37752 RepID=A0ABX4BZC6_9FLAO|nr:TonB-dependent receptor [Flavobacterium hibernum]OXA84649.1 SusC/RagA family TonB-linked outer membrane protein [Flavobacterium hibernum]PTT10189.1 TonB-dependent receptor [Flavobacterium sp. HMWF030]STO10343.1 Outer membrane receptor for ferrienterochelin and colicins [Flavobacterium hibernum]